MWWFVVGSGVLTALIALEARAVTSGRLHKWPERYAATDSPTELRHGFAVLWASAISLALATGVFALVAIDRPGWAALLMLPLFASGYLWWRWPRRPPGWMKPPWLVVREEALRRGETPTVPAGVEDGRLAVGDAQYYGTWAILLAGAVAAVVLRVWSLLVGVGVGLPYATVQRRRRRR